MAYEEYVRKAILSGRPYDELPEAVKARVPLNDWKGRVRDLCVQRGLAWDRSLMKGLCPEQEYYEQLVQTYKGWARLYPYHLSEYVCRVMRMTPFKYYNDVLFLTLKDEKSYDRIPNFTAADILRVTGVGRNEYIALMNACKAKKLLWRVNKGVARDLLPAAPLDIKLEPWWTLQVVNVGDAEFRELPGAEASLLRQAVEDGGSSNHGGPALFNFDAASVQSLYKKGIIYVDVPVAPTDRLSLPPLEGFVSNKTSEAGDESVDPFEPLLYSLFLANSSRLDQARLADILGVELQQLLLATSLAIRLGFATKISTAEDGSLAAATAASPQKVLPGSTAKGYSQVLSIPDSDDEAAATPAAAAAAAGSPAAAAGGGVWGSAGDGADSGAVAVVVDAEATSYLMMGALSPGLKRHSVTLFEGGRVGGAAVIDELISELAASAAAGADFEGDMVQLMQHIQSLAILLGVVRAAAAAQGQQLELLRKESLEGLDPASAAKVLCHAYTSIIPIAPMRGPALPLSPLAAASPVLYGPTPEADSPWLQLALYAAARAGPVSLVCLAGQRVWRLPHQLEGCTHALLWGWQGADGWAAAPLLVEGTNLLCTLNELLTRTAVMVQPLVHLQQLPSSADSRPLVSFIDVPLPLCAAQPADQQQGQQAQQQSPAVQVAAVAVDPAAVAGLAPPGGTAAAAAAAGSSSGLLPVGAKQDGGSAVSSQTAADAAGPGEQLMMSAPPGLPKSEALGSSAATVVSSRSGSVPLQLQQQAGSSSSKSMGSGSDLAVLAVDRQEGARLVQLCVPGTVVTALEQLQLRSAIGWLRMVKLPAPASTSGSSSASRHAERSWVPLSLNLGVPLFCPVLCQQVCANMAATECLSPGGRSAWRDAQQQLQQQLWKLIAQYGVVGNGSNVTAQVTPAAVGGGSNSDLASLSAGAGVGGALQQQLDLQRLQTAVPDGVELPACELLFDGRELLPLDVGECLQGPRAW